MAVNRFSKPVNNRIISQFVPQDMRMLAALVQGKEKRYDAASQRQELVQDTLSSLSGVGQADLDILKSSGAEMDKLSQEFGGKDLADPRIAKEFMTRSKGILSNPLVTATQQTVASVAKHKEDMQKAKLDGTYREENDPFYDQMENYNENGGAASGALGYNGIIKGVNERDSMEKLFNNMPDSGHKSFQMIGDKIKEVGFEGIDHKRMFGDPNDPNNNGMVGLQLIQHRESQAGQQQLRRYNMLQKRGQLPPEMSPDEYLLRQLVPVGAEQVGGKSVGGFAGGSAQSAGFGNTGGNEQVNKGFVSPMSRAISSAEFDKEKNPLGSGSISLWDDVIKGDATLSDYLFNNDDVTQEDKDSAMPLWVLSEENDITPAQAAEQINVADNPTYMKYNKGVKQRDAGKDFFTKGAGAYLTATIHAQGEDAPVDGRTFMEDIELIDDEGNFNDDVKNEIVILGEHNPKSGFIENGLHFSYQGKVYIAEYPSADRDPERQSKTDYINAELERRGIAKFDEKTYIYIDKNNKVQKKKIR